MAATIQEMEMVTGYAPEAVIQAYRRLIQLNMESWKPEVNDWLHSEEAEPVLEELLAMVPCSGTVH
jgi:hypothetical protein